MKNVNVKNWIFIAALMISGLMGCQKEELARKQTVTNNVNKTVAPTEITVKTPNRTGISTPGGSVEIQVLIYPENADQNYTLSILSGSENGTLANNILTAKADGVVVVKALTANGFHSDTCAVIITNQGTKADTTTQAPPAVSAAQADYYVSPSGNDQNPGTADKPFRTIEKAYSVAVAGNLVYFRGGTYKVNSSNSEGIVLNANRNGSEGNLIKFWAYPGETPVIDFSGMTNTSNRLWGMLFTGNYWHWKGFDFIGLPHTSGMNMGTLVRTEHASNCIWEQCRFHDADGNGFTIRWGDQNLVLNCDFYKLGGSADSGDPNGVMVVTDYGTTNTLRGCRAWWCTDDGFDMFGSNGAIVFDNCWSFWNGYLPGTFTDAPSGDGMGFKLGNSDDQIRTTILRKLNNCLAFQNSANGFDQNFDNDAITHFPIAVYNCTSFKNGLANNGTGFRFAKFNDANILENNVSYGDPYPSFVNSQTKHDHNSWDSGIVLSDADFISLNPQGADGPRKSDGSLPDINFMKPSVTSKLLNFGVNVGFSFTGSAPDIGYY